MSKTVLFDMDSIIADFYFGVMDAYRAETGHELDPEYIGGWDMDFPNGKNIFDYFSQPGFFRDLKPIPGALETIRTMRERGNQVLIVTAATLTNAPGEKYEWLDKHLSEFPRDDVIFAKRKYMIRGDVLIDDHAQNCSAFLRAQPESMAIGIEYPYNRSAPEAFTHLVPSFQDFRGAWQRILTIIG